MASSAKICTLLLLLTAHVMILVKTTSSSSHGGGGCIRRVDEVSSKYGSCHCYRKCSHPEEGWLTTAASQRCFVDCVLRHGCVCPGDDGEAALQGGSDDDNDASPPAAPPNANKPVRPVPAGLPAVLGEATVSVTVARPKVSRSRIDKEEEETLVLEVTFVPGTDADLSECIFFLHISTPSRPIRDKEAPYLVMPMNSKEASSGRVVLRFPIDEDLEKMGADGDNTIVVSFDPPHKVFPGDYDVDTFKKYRLTIHDAWVEYEPKKAS